MKKEKTKQANHRLPETLLQDVATIAPEIGESQTAFVIKALRTRVGAVKKRIERRQQAVSA